MAGRWSKRQSILYTCWVTLAAKLIETRGTIHESKLVGVERSYLSILRRLGKKKLEILVFI